MPFAQLVRQRSELDDIRKEMQQVKDQNEKLLEELTKMFRKIENVSLIKEEAKNDSKASRTPSFGKVTEKGIVLGLMFKKSALHILYKNGEEIYRRDYHRRYLPVVSFFEKEHQIFAVLDLSLNVNIMSESVCRELKKITEVKTVKLFDKNTEEVEIKWRHELISKIDSLVKVTIPFKIYDSKKVYKIDIYFGVINDQDFKTDFLVISEKFLRGRMPMIVNNGSKILIKPFKPKVEGDSTMSSLEMEVEEWV